MRSKYQYIFSCIRFYSDLVQDRRGGLRSPVSQSILYLERLFSPHAAQRMAGNAPEKGGGIPRIPLHASEAMNDSKP